MIRIDGWFCASSEPSSETAAYRGVLHSETGSEPSSEPGSETAVSLQEAQRATVALSILSGRPDVRAQACQVRRHQSHGLGLVITASQVAPTHTTPIHGNYFVQHLVQGKAPPQPSYYCLVV